MAWRLACAVLAAGVLMAPHNRVTAASADPLASLAERYVRLVLAVGQHDADYVDAYYGPPAWKPAAPDAPRPLDALAEEARTLASALEADVSEPPGDVSSELWTLRRRYLARQIEAVRARIAMLQGTRMTFDEESRALYDAVAPHHEAADFETVLAELDARLPGEGRLAARYERFKRDFVIPPDRLDRVFQTAIRACRDRTLAHVDLPPGEQFTVEYVTGKSWSGYNWYQGGFRSVIQVNTDLPIYVERALDLACHEGYPGHHVYNVLLEQHLVKGRGWVELSVYPLFSPQSLIAEGTANYGIDVAFPRDERVGFERDIIFPLAGLDPARAEEYEAVLDLVTKLDYAGNEAARQYLDGALSRDEAAGWLERYAMMPRSRAEQRVRFFDQYRSYVINYNLGRDLVKAFVERRADSGFGARWREFAALLSSPRLPSGLQ